MNERKRVVAALLLTALPALPAAAQDVVGPARSGGEAPARDVATIGRVVDGDGQPLAGALVTFTSSRNADARASVGAPHVVQTTSDAQGRFRVALRAGRSHGAWAIGPAGARPRLRSAVQPVLPGAVATLVADDPAPPPAARVLGCEQLPGGPFTLAVAAAATNAPTTRVPVAPDGACTLPDLPAGRAHARLLDARGDVVVGHLPVATEMVVPRPREHHFEVRDEAGRPVAGARVAMIVGWPLDDEPSPFGARCCGRARRTSAPTDASGRTAIVAFDEPVGSFAFADGRASRLGLDGPSLRLVDGVLVPEPAPAAAVTTLVLRPAAPFELRVRRGAAAIADLELQVDVRVDCAGAGAHAGLTLAAHAAFALRTDANGRAALDHLPLPASALQLAVADVDGVATAVRARRGAPGEPLELDLDACALAAWQVIDGRGTPAAGARVLLWPAGADVEAGAPFRLVADRAGRVRARLEPGAWFVVATDGEGVTTHVAAHTTTGAAAPTAVELRLQPLARMRGRVLDPNGAPRAGARFRFCGASVDPPRGEVTELERELRRHENALNVELTSGVRSAADGGFDVPFLPVAGVRRWGYVEDIEPLRFRGPLQLTAHDDVVVTLLR